MSFHDDLLDALKCVARKSAANPNGLSAETLKELCKKHSLPHSGTKSDTCKRLIAYYKATKKTVSLPKIKVTSATPVKPKIKGTTPVTPKAKVAKAPRAKVAKAPRAKAAKAPRAKAAKAPAKVKVPKVKVKPIIRRKLGQGTSGCAYTPVFDCEPTTMVGDVNKLTQPDTIAKISDEAVADLEFKTYSEMNITALDPTESFHIGNPLMCKPKQMKENCSVITDTPSQLIYKNGGMSLHNSFDIKASIRGLLNIARGLVILHRARIYHFDIKPDNLVIDDKGVCRMIDFGLAFHPKEHIHSLIVFESPYAFWPADANVFIPSLGNVKSYTFDIYQGIVQEYYTKATPYANLRGFMNTNVDVIAKDLQKLANTHTAKELLFESMRKVDTYSLGVTLLSLSRRLYDYPLITKIHAFLINSNTLHHNPFIRPDAETFYREYTAFVNSI